MLLVIALLPLCSVAPAALSCLCALQQKIADRKSKMLCIELDDLRGVSGSRGFSTRHARAAAGGV
jgi:hypothetical protein